MIDKVKQALTHYKELEDAMASPEVASNPPELEKFGREYNYLGKKVPRFKEYVEVVDGLSEAREMTKSESDPEMREMAREEVTEFEERLPALEDEIALLLVPEDPSDMKNAIMEIRAGTGGAEAAIFAGDLYRMYTNYFAHMGWSTEVLSSNYGELNGIKEIIFMVNGESSFGKLKFESGVHRVQRVPQTESQGRIHTSAASVVVLPEADGLEIAIDPSDLRIDVYRSSGPGGQSVNTTDSAVRIVHEPTGLTVTCQDEKSQHKNKAKALKVLQSRLYDIQLKEKEAEKTASRRSMVGSGDRSEKIRTYNYPQGRVTDHRINLTLYRLDEIVNGDLQEIIDALKSADISERLKKAV
ncbi:MAG: peptide chain release factor 1 [Chitinivibrionales bacterium]|nr:peptide chain release factor 1 [Chitinivibrionales bacterium]